MCQLKSVKCPPSSECLSIRQLRELINRWCCKCGKRSTAPCPRNRSEQPEATTSRKRRWIIYLSIKCYKFKLMASKNIFHSHFNFIGVRRIIVSMFSRPIFHFGVGPSRRHNRSPSTGCCKNKRFVVVLIKINEFPSLTAWNRFGSRLVVCFCCRGRCWGGLLV